VDGRRRRRSIDERGTATLSTNNNLLVSWIGAANDIAI